MEILFEDQFQDHIKALKIEELMKYIPQLLTISKCAFK